MKIDKHGNKIKVKSTEKRYLMNSIPYFIEIGEEWSPLIDQNCTEAKILYYGEQVEISRGIFYISLNKFHRYNINQLDRYFKD